MLVRNVRPELIVVLLQQGMTPLIHACSYCEEDKLSQKQVVNLLIKNKANVNKQDNVKTV